jgi:hypothetical protein
VTWRKRGSERKRKEAGREGGREGARERERSAREEEQGQERLRGREGGGGVPRFQSKTRAISLPVPRGTMAILGGPVERARDAW